MKEVKDVKLTNTLDTYTCQATTQGKHNPPILQSYNPTILHSTNPPLHQPSNPLPLQSTNPPPLHPYTPPIPIAPLITFRILFGALMFIGAIRFMWSGWVERLYVEPSFFFKFYGFEWVEPLGQTGMYMVYGLVALSALGIVLGFWYRLSAILFFLSFTYTELIDATNYLNHYYLVCLLAFLLIFLPAHRAFSLDVWRKPALKVGFVPAWTINILIVQLAIVYTFAGIAKLNPDWLLRAMPLAVWLPEHGHWPILGSLFEQRWAAFAFSWVGAFYDLSIAWFLLYRPTRPFAYIAVIGFHLLTGMLFNIGLFPYIMILSTLLFFSAERHQRWLSFLGYQPTSDVPYRYKPAFRPFYKYAIISYLLIQIILPFRYLAYPNYLLWSEEGYRFGWRVMLVEKAGHATFYVEDSESGRKAEITNSNYLTDFQEKQMAIQPDFILQYAHFLRDEFRKKHGFKNPKVTVSSYVALNGRTSQPFIDPEANLAEISDDFCPKTWVLPFNR